MFITSPQRRDDLAATTASCEEIVQLRERRDDSMSAEGRFVSAPIEQSGSSHWASFTGRLPESLYRDAQDLALVFNLSLNELLIDDIESFVRSQLEKSVIASAVERMRAAREVSSSAGGPRSRVRGGGAKAAKSRRST